MAIEKFWHNVRVSSQVAAPGYIENAPKLDAAAIDAALRDRTNWLTPKTVANFDPADFAFLPQAERDSLAKHVADVRQITDTLPKGTTGTPAQADAARPAFAALLRQLELDRYADGPAFKLGKQIEAAISTDRPAELAELRFRTGHDWTGDPALYIWAYLTDVGFDKALFPRLTSDLDELLFDTAQEYTAELWPYVDFRSLSEQDELVKLELE